MKKLLPLLLFVLMWLSSPGRAELLSPQVLLMIDGERVALAQPAIMYQGRVMVPLRGVFEHLGATVNYDPATHSIMAQHLGTDIRLGLGSTQAMVNGDTRTLDVPPLNLNGQVMVPLRFISQALGAEVTWVASNRTVNILSRTGGVDVLNSPTRPLPQSPQSQNAQNTSTSNLINAISVSPTSALPGQTVTVKMNGTPGGIASMIIGNSERIIMQESAPGTYIGTYAVPTNLEGKSQDVTIKLQLPNGPVDSITNINALSIGSILTTPNGVLPLEVISPNPASKVSQIFDLTGKTEPKALVRVRVLKNQHDEIASLETFADDQGNFHLRIDTGNLGSGTHLIVQMQSENSGGKSSEQVQMELARQ